MKTGRVQIGSAIVDLSLDDAATGVFSSLLAHDQSSEVESRGDAVTLSIAAVPTVDWPLEITSTAEGYFKGLDTHSTTISFSDRVCTIRIVAIPGVSRLILLPWRIAG